MRPDLMMVDVVLLDEGDPDWNDPAGADPTDAADPPAPDPARRRRRRLRGTALLTVLVLAAAAAGLQTWQERSAADRRTALPELVEPLTDPLVQAWRVEIPDGAWVLGNVLVTTDAAGEVLTGHDVHDGAPIWVADSPLDGRLNRCVATDPADDPQVVCAAGSDGTVMVVDATDGAMTSLPGPADLEGLATIGPDLVRLTSRGDEGAIDRVDPRTGAVRWSTPLELTGLARTDLRAADGLVTLSGASAAVLAGGDGTVLGLWEGTDPANRVDGAAVRTAPAGFGVWVQQSGRAAPGGDWFTSEGEPVGRVDGYPLRVPGDGSAADVLLTASRASDPLAVGSAPVLRAVQAGAVLWAARGDQGLPVLRTGGRAVLAGAGVLRAVDLATGVQAWRVELADTDQVTSISDGRHVLVVRSGVSDGRRIAAYATSDGTVAWTTPMEPGWELLPSGADVVLVRDGAAIIGLR